MYKLVLVDDERIIRESIAAMINWEEHGIALTGVAADGLEAYELICTNPPDIVIADIKMPGMNGLELIAEVKKKYPEILFIILSGYEEFEFAKTAMQYGVKYYLLKPSNEKKIIEALNKIKAEIEKKQAKEKEITKIKKDFKKILPRLKEQFFKEFVTNKSCGIKEWEYYRDLLGLHTENQFFRLLVCQTTDRFAFEYLFALKKIAEKIINKDNLLLSTTIGEQVLFLVRNMEIKILLSTAKKIKKKFYDYYHVDVTIALSGPGKIEETQALFSETREYIKHGFYLGEGSVITKQDIDDNKETTKFGYDYDQIGTLIKSGDVKETKTEIDRFFYHLQKAVYEKNIAVTYCLNLFSAVIRESPEEELSEYMKKIFELVNMDTLDQIHRCVRETAVKIAQINYENNRRRNNKKINKVIELVKDNMGREELSLKWLANELLYMNADYLGKLFKKEKNERFSDYVMRLRMEKAKELIRKGDYKIFEITEKVGFGDNSQYFSQVFKKYTGYTPTEYRKASLVDEEEKKTS